MAARRTLLSTSKGIDDAVLLMVALTLKNMGLHCSIISNDKFHDYQLGDRLNLDEMMYENNLEWWNRADVKRWREAHPAEAKARQPKRPPVRLRRLPVRPGLGRQISRSGANTDYSSFRVIPVEGDLHILNLKKNTTESIATSTKFEFACAKVLAKKLNVEQPYNVVQAFRDEVVRFVYNVTNQNKGDIVYIVDVENIFHKASYVKSLPALLPEIDKYIRRRWVGQILWGRGVDGNVLFGGVGYKGVGGANFNRIRVIFPAFRENRYGAFKLALERVQTEMEWVPVFDVGMVPYSIGWFNRDYSGSSGSAGEATSADSTPETSRSSSPAGGGSGGFGRLHDLITSMVKLRF